jgi:hypothetical protein
MPPDRDVMKKYIDVNDTPHPCMDWSRFYLEYWLIKRFIGCTGVWRKGFIDCCKKMPYNDRKYCQKNKVQYKRGYVFYPYYMSIVKGLKRLDE